MIKLLLALCVICCAFALAFGIAACSDDETSTTVTIADITKQNDGSLLITYTDGTTKEITGTSGEDGENGEDGLGIADVTVVDGKLNITYTDGSSDSFDLVSEDSDCEHENSVTVTVTEPVCEGYDADDNLVDATQVVDGVYVYICEDCNGAWTETVETTGHNWTTWVEPATCEEYGYTVQRCSVCGMEDEDTQTSFTTPIEHDYSDEAEYYIPATSSGNVCVVGGWAVYFCTNDGCDDYTLEVVPTNAGHSIVSDWEVTTLPSFGDEGAGKVTGYCAICKEYGQTASIPALVWETADDGHTEYAFTEYEIEDEDTTNCVGDKGVTLTLSYTTEDGYTYDNIKVTITNIAHVSNGEVIFTTGSNVDEIIVYTTDHFDSYEFADNGDTCSEAGETIAFYCDICDALATATARNEHTKPEVASNTTAKIQESEGKYSISVNDSEVASSLEVGGTTEAFDADVVYYMAPSCTAPGYTAYLCTECGEFVVETTNATGHSWTYTAEVAGTDGNGKITSINVSAKCTNTGCTETENKDTAQKDSYAGAYTSEQFTYTDVAATCEADGTRTYTITVGSKTFTATTTLAKTNHQIVVDGKKVDLLPSGNESGVTYPSSVIYDTEDHGAACADETTGWAYCVDCGAGLLVDVKDDHSEPEDLTVVTLKYTDSGYVDAADTATEPTVLVNCYGGVYSWTDGDLDEDYVYVIAATCESGEVRIFLCEECDAWGYTVGDPLGHTYEDTIYKISIWVDGDVYYTSASDMKNEEEGGTSLTGTLTVTVYCSVCNVSSGENKGEGIPVTVPALYVSDGNEGTTLNEVYDIVSVKYATCDSQGYIVYQATYTDADGKSFTYQVVVVEEATGHKTANSTSVPVTVGETNYTADVCDVCGQLWNLTEKE